MCTKFTEELRIKILEILPAHTYLTSKMVRVWRAKRELIYATADPIFDRQWKQSYIHTSDPTDLRVN